MSEQTFGAGGRAPRIDLPVFILSGGFITLFVVLAIFDIDLVSALVNEGFAWSVEVFGAFWQVLLLLTFLIGLGIAASPAGSYRMGGTDTPDITTFSWVAMIMCTLLAGGGVFWAAAEPIAHFLSPPPLFGGEGATEEAVAPALAQAFMHWGFLAWAILGSLTALILMYYHHEKGLPLAPRTLLYPVFKEKATEGPLGTVVDACCVLAVVAGTIGPIGFLGLQVSYGLQELFGTTDGLLVQSLVVIALVAIYTISAITGLRKGIRLLSRFNVILAFVLMAFILLFGPTAFIIDGFVEGMGTYVHEFIPMALYRGDGNWLGWWTVFFWGWFLGYGPLMAMFVSRISRGRSIRAIILAVSVIAPIATCFWFTIVGGSGMAFELANPGSISEPFEGLNLPASLMAITQQMPLGFLVSLLFLVLTFIFVATTGDSMTYTISMVMSQDDEPTTHVRVFWGIAMGAVAIILIMIGEGSVSALQSFIVITAVPVSLILLPSLWTAPQIAMRLARQVPARQQVAGE